MAQERVMNRWLVPVGALMVQLILGVIYAWSVFLIPLSKQYGWDRSDVVWAYSIDILTFGLVMAYAGRLQDRLGPRTVCMIGGVVMGVGFILASFTTTLWWLILTYGVVVGAGIAMSYVTPIATLIKWFPDMRGLMTGVAVAGFGLSTFFLGPLAQRMVEAIGVVATFRYLGIAFIIIVVAGAQFLRNPPAGWLPEGYTPPVAAKTDTGAEAQVDFEPGEILRMPQGIMLWLAFLCHATAGLMVIGFLSPFAQERGMTAAAAAGVVGLAALFNGAGRIGGGWLSDRIGRRGAMVTLFGATTLLMFITPLSAGTTIGLILAVGVIYFTYGSNFALFPSTVADFFGTKNVGANYGLIFTSWGFAGVAAGRIGARVYAATGAYTNAFYISGVLAAISVILIYLLKKPAAREMRAEA
ncbi:MAG: OFA family MFS transporter [Anaerolineae bacterium]